MKVKVYLEYDFEYEGFIADCPTLPGCIAQGKTEEEALSNIKEAIKGYIKVAKKHNKMIPVEEPCYVEVAV